MLVLNPIQIVWKILGRKAKALVVGGIRQIIFSFYSLPDISIFWGPELSSSITWNFQWLSRNCTQSFGSTPKNFKPRCNMKATCNIKVFFKLPCQAETRKRVISKKTWIDLPFDDLFVFCFYEGRNSDDPSFYYYCTTWCTNSSSRCNDKTFYPISILLKIYPPKKLFVCAESQIQMDRNTRTPSGEKASCRENSHPVFYTFF